MTDSSPQTVTRLLLELREGNQAVTADLFHRVYEELHELAGRQRRGWQGDLTLNATALVHEAYLKLVDQTQASWETRAHFLATAARAMRQILINYGKSRRRKKRGGEQPKVSLDELTNWLRGEAAISDASADALALLDEVLTRLEKVNPRQSRIVECRFFAGMTIEETAAALAISPMTVKRGWSVAQLWLYRELRKELD